MPASLGVLSNRHPLPLAVVYPKPTYAFVVRWQRWWLLLLVVVAAAGQGPGAAAKRYIENFMSLRIRQ